MVVLWSGETGWKPILHCARASVRWVREQAPRNAFLLRLACRFGDRKASNSGLSVREQTRSLDAFVQPGPVLPVLTGDVQESRTMGRNAER